MAILLRSQGMVLWSALFVVVVVQGYEEYVGIGVGNLGHELIESVVKTAVTEYKVKLIDTAQASRNEAFIARAIKGARDVVVVSKVWYTMLGYERTRRAVAASREILDGNDLVILIHWPYCRDDISWMRCLEEEKALPAEIQALDIPPHLNKENAWKESWKALEEAYRQDRIQGIGISNFDMTETRDLFQFATVFPHYAQINVWHALYNQPLIAFLQSRNVTIQVYNVMNGIVARRRQAPKAYEKLQAFAPNATVATVVLAWLARQKIATIPRTASVKHMQENAPLLVAQLAATIQPAELADLAISIRALFEGQDHQSPTDPAVPTPVQATFVLAQADVRVELFFIPEEKDQSLKELAELHSKGDAVSFNAYPGNRFLARIVRDEEDLGTSTILQSLSYSIDPGATEPQKFYIASSSKTPVPSPANISSYTVQEFDELEEDDEEDEDGSALKGIDVGGPDDEL